MLTPNQEKYLLTIPEDKVAKVIPFSPKSRQIAEKVVEQVNQVFLELKVLFIGQRL